MMDWAILVASALSGLAGGFVGGWTVAFRLGAWRQSVESRLEEHERSLENGKPRVRHVPILDTKLEAVLGEIRNVRAQLREDRDRFVTRDVCEEKHRE